MRRRLDVMAAVVLVFVALTPAPASAATNISVKPGSGAPGTMVTVDGVDFFDPNVECTLHLTDQEELPAVGDPPQVGTCTVANTVLTGSFTVPDWAPGAYTLWACNRLEGTPCSAPEFVERASAPFTITAPPTTTTTSTTTGTTQAPPTTGTTQAPPTTGTTQPSTTDTTLPDDIALFDFPLDELPDGWGLDDGIWGPSVPLTVPDGRFEIPEDLFLRCGPLSSSTVWGFDDQTLGDTPEYPPYMPFIGTVVRPDLGSISAPFAVRQRTSSGLSYRVEEPLRYFGVHVGLPDGAAGPVVFQLEAGTTGDTYDADRVTLTADPGPATNCVMVQWPEGLDDQRFIRFTVFSESGDAIDVDYDDVFFGTDEYPIVPQPERATVRFLRPLDGDTVRTERPTVLLGEVRWPDGLDLDAVRILRPTWDGSAIDSTLADVTRSWLMDDGVTRRALFWLDGVYLAPGFNVIEAFAYGPGVGGIDVITVVGDGEATPPPDAYQALVEGIVDIVPWAMEVTQAIRGPLVVQTPGSVITDDFNHVADKGTVVRGYAVQQFEPGTEPERVQRLTVEALLHATRDGATLPGSPLDPTSTAFVWDHAPGPEAEAASRTYLSRTWNFRLPQSWTVEGDVELRLEVNPTTEDGHIDEAPGAGGGENFIGQRVMFSDVGEINLRQTAVELYYRCDEERIGGGVVQCGRASEGDVESGAPAAGEMQYAVRGAWSLMPAPGRGPTMTEQARLRVAEKDPPGGSIDREVLATPLMTGWLSGMDYDTVTRAYGDLNCAGDLMIFHTSVPWPDVRTPSVFFNTTRVFGKCTRGTAWVGELATVVSEPDPFVLAHEIGHALGLEHLRGGSEADSPRDRWSGDGGELAEPGVTTYGFDVAEMVVIPSDGYFDLMSYGKPQWVSIGTWDHMFNAFRGGGPISDGRSGSPSDYSDVGSSSAGLVVGGTDDGDDAASEPGTGIPFDLDTSDITLRVLDADGVPLAEVGAVHERATGWFTGFVPPIAGAGSIEVLLDGEPIGSIEEGGGDLTVAFPGPPDLSGPSTRIEWFGPEGVSYLLEVSRDGDRWWPLGRTDSPGFDFDPGTFPFHGAGWTLRVQATDGVRLVTDEVEGIDFGIRPPAASIAWPLDGESIPARMTGAAAVADPSGITGYSWYLDGELAGGGPETTLPLVAPGSHEIRLVASNSAGTDETTISVWVFQDLDADGMDDAWEESRGLDPTDPDDGMRDDDGDGLTNNREHRAGSEPDSVDSDGDDYSDGVEVEAGSDPADPESLPVWLGFEEPVVAPRLSGGSGPGSADDGGLPWPVILIGGGVLLGAAAVWLWRRPRG